MNVIDMSQYSKLIIRVNPGIYVTYPITDLKERLEIKDALNDFAIQHAPSEHDNALEEKK